MNNISTPTIEQHTTVYSIEYGKGTIVTIQYRTDGGLAMCYFPKVKVHDWACSFPLSKIAFLTPINTF